MSQCTDNTQGQQQPGDRSHSTSTASRWVQGEARKSSSVRVGIRVRLDTHRAARQFATQQKQGPPKRVLA